MLWPSEAHIMHGRQEHPTSVVGDYHQGAGVATCSTYGCQDRLCGRRGKDVPCHSSCKHARADIPRMCWLMSAASTCDNGGIKSSGREDAMRKQGDGWNGVMKMAYLRLLLPCFHLPWN